MLAIWLPRFRIFIFSQSLNQLWHNKQERDQGLFENAVDLLMLLERKDQIDEIYVSFLFALYYRSIEQC